jgi:hypothetical protein
LRQREQRGMTLPRIVCILFLLARVCNPCLTIVLSFQLNWPARDRHGSIVGYSVIVSVGPTTPLSPPCLRRGAFHYYTFRPSFIVCVVTHPCPSREGNFGYSCSLSYSSIVAVCHPPAPFKGGLSATAFPTFISNILETRVEKSQRSCEKSKFAIVPAHEQDKFTCPFETITTINLEVYRFKL